MTMVVSILYFPFVIESLWHVDSAHLSFIWCGIQLFIGITLFDKKCVQFRYPILIFNFICQFIWSLLILNQLMVVSFNRIEYYPYLLHVILALGSGWSCIKLKKETSPIN